MYTAETVFSRRNELLGANASKPAIIRELAPMCTGWPYVFGAWGAECTPENRRTYADRCRAKHPDYSAKIIKACPVLSGKQPACIVSETEWCKWIDCLCFDCRGYTHWLLEQVGLQLYGDTVSTQWETKSNWAVQGDISALPAGLVACLFRERHTGAYLGDGATSDCSTSVREGTMPGSPKWQKFGIPAGLYTIDELREAGLDVDAAKNTPTIRKGANGPLVERLQELLNQTGAGLTVDGIFGTNTELAVMHFQGLHDLREDGICGPKTWAALDAATAEPGTPEKPAEPEEPEPPGIWISLDDWRAIKAAAATLMAAVKKYE